MTEKQLKVRGIVGQVLSQLLNVPVLSGALVTYLYFRLPANEANALSGYVWAMRGESGRTLKRTTVFSGQVATSC